MGQLLAARAALLRRMKNPLGAECVVRLDRLRGVSDQDPTSALMNIPGFRAMPIIRLRHTKGTFQPYGQAQWFHSTRNEAKFTIESDRRERFLDPFKITFFADDIDGLLPEQVFSVLELMPSFRMTMVELAFDFMRAMDRRRVRREGLFGKSRPIPSVGSTDYWGTRKGMKRVQCYFKLDVQAFRVELEMHSRFLRYYKIRTPFDFKKLVDVLPARHIYFGKFNNQKVARRIVHMGLSATRRQDALKMIARMRNDLWATLNFLRGDLDMKNTRRLVDGSPINRDVLSALNAWISKWPVRPQRLGGRP
jgi:hypothetical protein